MKKIILLFSALILTSLTTFSQWTQKDDFGGTERACTVSFSIGSKGYIGLGCDFMSTLDFWEFDPSGVFISEIENEFKISPNPTNGDFMIAIPSPTGKIQIYNSTGQLLQSKIVDKETDVNFRLDKSGIYFIQIITDKEILTKKLLVTNY